VVKYMCLDCSVLPGQESEWSYMCARIAVFYQVRRLSGHICVLGLQCFTKARRVSGHICLLGLQCFTRLGE